METVFIQIRAPKGHDPGKVLEGHYNIIGDTVFLVDKTGKPLTSEDQKYSRKLTAGEAPKQVAAQLLRLHHRHGSGSSPRGWNDRLAYSPLQPNGNGLQSVYLTEIPTSLAEVLMGLIGKDVWR
jgi:hypothetical protein